MDLFDYMRENTMEKESPLASRLRPRTLDEVVGQQHIIGKDKLLYRAIKADKLGSVIFYGPPGTGKTTLAKVIANTTQADFKQINATVAGKKDMEEVVTEAKNNMGMYGRRTILFVDEIHRLNRQVEEVLYPAMEDFAIDIMLGKESSARSIRLELPHFTLVGATTRAGLLSAPLRDRFGVVQRMEFYTPEELRTIIQHSATILGVEIEPEGAIELAKRSRGTPRLANRLLKRVRDFAQVKYDGVITKEVADFALDIMDVDKMGLDQNDRNILLMIIEKFSGGPVGLDTLAAALGEDAGTLEDVYEPYLLMNGLINRTPRGRMATENAYRHLGLEMK
jgi:Holliday junction DNA helicase RuvB